MDCSHPDVDCEDCPAREGCPQVDTLHPEYVPHYSEDAEDLAREGGLCYTCEYKRIYDEFIVPMLRALRGDEK